jgi:hypothetical protein
MSRRVDAYRVYYNADCNGHAVRVTLAPRDRWVGHDYWRYVETWTPRRIDRALRVMQILEFKQQTSRYWYRLAQSIALAELAGRKDSTGISVLSKESGK